MLHLETFDTEGVLILANVNKLKEFYSDKEFNYSYPEGLEELIRSGIIHVVTTEETVENLNFTYNENEISTDDWALYESNNYISVEVRLLSHADFTRMCSEKRGDYYSFFENQYFIAQKINPEIEKNAIDFKSYCEMQSPLLRLKTGLNQVLTYSNTNMNPNLLVEFTFLFRLTGTIKKEEITVQPLEIYG